MANLLYQLCWLKQIILDAAPQFLFLETNLFITVSLETNSLYHSFSFVKQPYPGIFRNWNMTNWTSISFWDQSLRQVIFQPRW